MAPARVLTGATATGRARPRSAAPRPFPVIDMIEVKLRTRSGRSIARICAIIPPSEMPTTCAESNPRFSITPAVSAAISASV